MKFFLLEWFLQSKKNKMRKIVCELELRGDEELLSRLDEAKLKSFSYGFSHSLFRSIEWCSIKVFVAKFDSFYYCHFEGFFTAFVCISCSSQCYHCIRNWLEEDLNTTWGILVADMMLLLSHSLFALPSKNWIYGWWAKWALCKKDIIFERINQR